LGVRFCANCRHWTRDAEAEELFGELVLGICAKNTFGRVQGILGYDEEGCEEWEGRDETGKD
jgi:hypothetical protein